MSIINKVTTIAQSIGGLLGDARYADFTVRCGERRWKVHKAIVCSRCKFFEKACDGRFKESTDKTVTLEDDAPNAVAAMLRYLYADDYDDTSDREGCPPLLFNVLVLVVGDKYDLPGLVALAEKKFQDRIQSGAFSLVELSDAMREAYSLGMDPVQPLRRHIMNHVMGTGQQLLQDDTFIQITKSLPAFAAELVAETFRLGKRDDLARPGEWNIPAPFARYRCFSCNHETVMKRMRTYRPGYTRVVIRCCSYCQTEWSNDPHDILYLAPLEN